MGSFRRLTYAPTPKALKRRDPSSQQRRSAVAAQLERRQRFREFMRREQERKRK